MHFLFIGIISIILLGSQVTTNGEQVKARLVLAKLPLSTKAVTTVHITIFIKVRCLADVSIQETGNIVWHTKDRNMVLHY